MINEEKVRLMTQLSILEESFGKGNFKIASYYRSDYIGIELMKTFLLTTIGYGIAGGGIFLLYTQRVSILGVKELEKAIIFLGAGYICILLIYLLLTYVLASKKYENASRFMEEYHREYTILEKGYLRVDGSERISSNEGDVGK